MNDLNNLKKEYFSILNRIEKKNFLFEGLLISFKQYSTNNTFYYCISIINRFIPFILLSGNYFDAFKENYKSTSIYRYLKLLTLHSIAKFTNFSYTFYISLNILIYILFLITIIIYLLTLKDFNDYKYTDKFPIPNVYRVINDHLIFLLFPGLIEFLSFSYYFLFFPNDFIIKFKGGNIALYTIIIINSILIIMYNIINFICLTTSNKVYTTTLIESYLKITSENNAVGKKPILYRFSKFEIFIAIIFHNMALFTPIEQYLNHYKKIIFKIGTSIILLLVILFYFCCKMYEYNYTNTINTLYCVLILYCYYSIVVDFILYLFDYNITNNIFEIIYIIMKVLASYITYLLYINKMHKYFENKIVEILFQEKKNEKEVTFLN
jgi:hypothetical protein